MSLPMDCELATSTARYVLAKYVLWGEVLTTRPANSQKNVRSVSGKFVGQTIKF